VSSLVATVSFAQVPIGDEFRLHEEIGNIQLNSGICSDASGAFLGTWDHLSRIWARGFDAGGEPLWPSIELTNLESSYGIRPRCDLNSWGEGAAVWGAGAPSNVTARPIEPGILLGPESWSFWSDHDHPSGNVSVASCGADGSINVSWIAAGSRLDLLDVWVQTAQRDGTLGPGPLRAQTDGPFNSSFPTETDVAWLDGGRLVVVWNAPGADLDQDGILARIYDAEGNPEGPAFLVNSYEIDLQIDPEVDSDAAGNFLVVWDSFWQDGSGEGIFAQRFDRLGHRLGPEIQVSSDVYSGQYEPSVAVDWAGNAVVSYSSIQEGEDLREDVYIRAYRADGTALGEQVMLNQQVPGPQDKSSVTLSDAGTGAASWHSFQLFAPFNGSEDVLARRFSLPCLAGETTLCLQGGRFLVRALYETAAGARGFGQSIELSPDSGGFWFFAEDNFELLVKVVNGCDWNGRFWIYAAGLTDVEVRLVVTDTWTGAVETYTNPQGTAFVPVQQIEQFATCAAVEPVGFAVEALPVRARLRTAPAAGAAPGAACVPDATRLCLNGGRFRASATWTAFDGSSGSGIAAALADDSGLFWFFDPEILELAVKVIDGCDLNQRFWVYAAGLTNVAVTLTVEDTERGVTWQRSTALAEPFPPILDSAAFATCP